MPANKKWEAAQGLLSIQKEISRLFTAPKSPERTTKITHARQALRLIKKADLDALAGSKPNSKKLGDLKAMRHALSRLFRSLKILESRPVSERTPARLRHDLEVLQRKIDQTRDHLTPTFRARNFPARDNLRHCIDERGEILTALTMVTMEQNQKKEVSYGDSQ